MYLNKKSSFYSLVFFLLSPFLTVLMQVYHIARGNRFALKLFIATMGLVGYIFVPEWTNDKTRYYERYEEFKNYDVSQFTTYLVISNRPDFIYESLIFLFAYFGLSIQLLFFIINTFCIYSIFKITDLITNYFKSNKRFVCFLLILFSFALQHLYSGIRFTFTACIVLWAIYLYEYKQQKLKAILLFAAACLTHFSFIVFILAFVIYKIVPKYNFKYFFIFSLLFLFIPKEFLMKYFTLFDAGDGYSNKVDLYVNGDDFSTKNFENNISSIIVYYARNLWIYFAYIILLLKKNSNKKIIQLLFVFMAFLNVFYAFPTIFSRYLIFCKFLFTIYLISEYLESKNNKTFNLLFILYFITFVIDAYVLRNNWAATFNDISIINIFTTLAREVNLSNVIDNRP